MNSIRVVGIDIAKFVCQVCIWMTDGSVAWNRKISRQKLQNTLRQFEPCKLIAMESCSTSDYWGRILSAIGFRVIQHVKVVVMVNHLLLYQGMKSLRVPPQNTPSASPVTPPNNIQKLAVDCNPGFR